MDKILSLRDAIAPCFGERNFAMNGGEAGKENATSAPKFFFGLLLGYNGGRKKYFLDGLGTMKKNTHPEYRYIEAVCSCGNKLQIGTTCKQERLQLDICSKCHPFYTGKQKFVDTSGRVEQFRRRYGGSAAV